MKLQEIPEAFFMACPKGRAIHYKSSHFLCQAVGFPLLSLTQNGKQRFSFQRNMISQSSYSKNIVNNQHNSVKQKAL